MVMGIRFEFFHMWSLFLLERCSIFKVNQMSMWRIEFLKKEGVCLCGINGFWLELYIKIS